MKKILHLFSDPSHSALWSRYLRMITMIALLAFGSLGGWGAELPARLGTPAGNGTWNEDTKTYTWNSNTNNLMDLFFNENLTGRLGTEYAAIVITTSNYSNQPYRIVFLDENINIIATISFYSAGEKTLVFADRKETKDLNLSSVRYIRFGGDSGNGSITLDYSKTKLVGHKVTFSATPNGQGNVTATYYGKDFQSGNAVAPGTELTLTATPTADNLFWTWRQKIDGNYTPAWDGKYTAGFHGATSTATINQDLDMQADFSSIWLSAKQKDTDKEYGSVKILQYGNDKGTDYHTTPWPPDIKFVAEDGPSGSFKGWYKDASYTQQADDVTKDEKNYTYTDKTYCPQITDQNVTLFAKFECNIQNNTQIVVLDVDTTKLDRGSNVKKVEYKNNELVVTTIKTNDNVLYLKKFDKNENKGTGIRIHAKGDKYRLIVRLDSNKDSTKVIKIDEATDN